MDRLFQNAIESALKFRYERIVEGLPVWPWSLGIFLLGFVVLLVFVLLVVLYLTLVERKLLGWLQIRLGPNRVGPWGLLQPFADMIKLLIKEDIVPCAADRWLHLIAPLLIFVPTMLAFVVIPFGKGTVELPQQYVAPTFERMWVAWVSPEDAAKLGYSQQGWIEASVKVETDESTHKTYWVSMELDHEALFLPADPNYFPLDKQYRIWGTSVLQVKPANANEKPVYGQYYVVIDYGSSGRRYDVLEIEWPAGRGHQGVIELGMNGELVDTVEKNFAEIIQKTGPDVPNEDRYNFSGVSPENTLKKQFDLFAESVALNNRAFGPDSMVPAFDTRSGSRLTWRDIYTPDLSHAAFVHGAVNPDELKGGLYFFPAAVLHGRAVPEQQYEIEGLDWRKAGASFRLQRITGGGYTVEPASGEPVTLKNPGDSTQVPLGDSNVVISLKDRQFYNFFLMGKNLNIGILYIFAATSLTVLGIFMAGFGSNNKWSLYGAMRSAAQLISYEIPMTLAVLGPILMTGSLATTDLVEAQRSTWFFIPQFIAFFVFTVCMTAEVNRNPFDLPEAESELVAGFHTEYSGLKFGFFFLAEYANMFVAASLMTVLFFGGWKGPIIPFLGEFVSSFIWFMLKTFIWLCIFIWFRGTFPRFRIDQLMDYAWKVLVPLALLNIIYTGYMTYSDWYFPIWQENNWRIWEMYIKPLFANLYTNYFAIPAIAIIVVMVGLEYVYRFLDYLRAEKKGRIDKT